MLDLYSIGEMVIDFIPGTEPASYVRNAGGAPANVAIAVARNGLKSGMCCSVGDDDFGRFLVQTLNENHVRCLHPELCTEAITTMAFVTLSSDGDRSFTFARKPGADMFLKESDVRESDIDDAIIIHAGSCSLSAPTEDAATVKALRLGREKGKLVSFDVNYRDLMWGGDMQACVRKVNEILPFVDLLKISQEEAPMLGGDIFACMSANNLTLVVETLGGGGARCYFNNQDDDMDSPGGEVMTVTGRTVDCIDATGAGDAFWGGFLSSLRIQRVKHLTDFTREKVQAALKYGNIAGSICVQSKGAIASLPTRAQIEALL